MRKTAIAALAFGAAAALALTACSGGGSAGGDDMVDVDSVDGTGKTITVWVMNGDLSDDAVAALVDEFESTTGATAKVEMQQWDGITTKLTTALAGSTPPDVIDIGNTQVAGYAATGGLADLTAYRDELAQGQEWLGGLVDPATIDGKLYAVPSFAGDRAVIYNKTMWAEAGVTAAPTTFDELTAALDKVKAANTASDFSALYLPGQLWYAGMQFVWDAGGEVAINDGGTWKGGLSSPEAQKGLMAYRDFQNAYSSEASRTVNSNSPDQDAILANGQAGAIISTASHLKKVIDAGNLAESDLGTFPFPGVSGENQPVMLGGSDWGIAQKSDNKDLALAWIKLAAGPSFQADHVFGTDGWIPNSVQGIEAAQTAGVPDQSAAYFTAALRSKATPAAENWPVVEGDKTMEQFFQAIATGADPVQTAADADAHIESVLNGN
ncbi:extracellular solute-binding protein [Microbacterium sp.]|uniref:extracellular solute-binding protein n=1 Tax=Microbacterium sp. TaxID=51671 RepID=UPI003A84F3D0